MQTKQIVPFAANFYSIIKINTKNLKKMEKILIYLTDKYHGCFKYWWLSLILGIIFLALGILTFIFPFTSYLTMSIIFGITILVSGIFYIVMSTTRSMKGRGWLIVSGLIEIVLGILLTLWPGISAAREPLPSLTGTTPRLGERVVK